MNKIITALENQPIMELSEENRAVFEMLEDFALRNEKPVMKVSINGIRRIITAGNYVGIIKLSDGTRVQILPDSGGFSASVSALYRLVSAKIGISSDEFSADSEESIFPELIIDRFIGEALAILKSGMLSGYTTVEETTSTLRGRLMFAENIRENFYNTQQFHVRNEVFSADKPENRIMKSTALELLKMTELHQSKVKLRRILSYLDNIETSADIKSYLAKCSASRSSKKYSTLLDICRFFLDNGSSSNFRGKYVTGALLLPTAELFSCFIARAVRRKYPDLTVKIAQHSAYISDEPKHFALTPDILICKKDEPICIIRTRNIPLRSARDISREDMLFMYACGKKLGCANCIVLYPQTSDSCSELVYHADELVIRNLSVDVSASVDLPDLI